MSKIMRIVFTDGSTGEARINHKALVVAERHFGRLPELEGPLYAAWTQLAPGTAFDAWLDTIEDAKEATVDPTEARPSTESPS